MPIQIRGGGTWLTKEAPSPRLVEAADKVERGAVAGVIVHRELLHLLAAIPPEQFRSDQHRALRNHLVDGGPAPPETLALLAELDYWAHESEGIDKATAEIYLLRMTEREAQSELQRAELERVPALSAALVRIRETIAGLERRTAAPD
jgi:hypothetical protein